MKVREMVARKWGNSLGFTLPKEAVEEEHIKENEKVRILILPKGNPLEETFGKFPSLMSGQEMKDRTRKELHGIE